MCNTCKVGNDHTMWYLASEGDFGREKSVKGNAVFLENNVQLDTQVDKVVYETNDNWRLLLGEVYNSFHKIVKKNFWFV